MALTALQITEELAVIRAQILALEAQKTGSYSVQGRQWVGETSRGKLETLYAREKELLADLVRVQAGLPGRSGLRVRYGVPVR